MKNLITVSMIVFALLSLVGTALAQNEEQVFVTGGTQLYRASAENFGPPSDASAGEIKSPGAMTTGIRLTNGWWMIRDQQGVNWYVYDPGNLLVTPMLSQPTAAPGQPAQPPQNIATVVQNPLSGFKVVIAIIAAIAIILYTAIFSQYESRRQHRGRTILYIIGGTIAVIIAVTVEYFFTGSKSCFTGGAACIPTSGIAAAAAGIVFALDIAIPLLIRSNSAAITEVDRGAKTNTFTGTQPEVDKWVATEGKRVHVTGRSESAEGKWTVSYRPYKEVAKRDMTFLTLWFLTRSIIGVVSHNTLGVQFERFPLLSEQPTVALAQYVYFFTAALIQFIEVIREMSGRARQVLIADAGLFVLWVMNPFLPGLGVFVPQVFAWGAWKKEALAEGVGDVILFNLIIAALLVLSGQYWLLDFWSPVWATTARVIFDVHALELLRGGITWFQQVITYLK